MWKRCIFGYNRRPGRLRALAERVSNRQWVIDGVAFYAVDGVGFRFNHYRDSVHHHR
jgi:hypothetical protein